MFDSVRVFGCYLPVKSTSPGLSVNPCERDAIIWEKGKEINVKQTISEGGVTREGLELPLQSSGVYTKTTQYNMKANNIRRGVTRLQVEYQRSVLNHKLSNGYNNIRQSKECMKSKADDR